MRQPSCTHSHLHFAGVSKARPARQSCLWLGVSPPRRDNLLPATAQTFHRFWPAAACVRWGEGQQLNARDQAQRSRTSLGYLSNEYFLHRDGSRFRGRNQSACRRMGKTPTQTHCRCFGLQWSYSWLQKQKFNPLYPNSASEEKGLQYLSYLTCCLSGL